VMLETEEMINEFKRLYFNAYNVPSNAIATLMGTRKQSQNQQNDAYEKISAGGNATLLVATSVFQLGVTVPKLLGIVMYGNFHGGNTQGIARAMRTDMNNVATGPGIIIFKNGMITSDFLGRKEGQHYHVDMAGTRLDRAMSFHARCPQSVVDASQPQGIHCSHFR
jgi:hypothetical protein